MEKNLAKNLTNQFIKITWGTDLDQSLIDDSCRNYVKIHIEFFLIFQNSDILSGINA